MKDLTKQKDSELAKELRKKKEELRKVRFGIGKNNTPSAHKTLRREIARIMTELTIRTK